MVTAPTVVVLPATVVPDGALLVDEVLTDDVADESVPLLSTPTVRLPKKPAE